MSTLRSVVLSLVVMFSLCAQAQALEYSVASDDSREVAEGVTYHHYKLNTGRGSMFIHTVAIDPLASYALMPVIANEKLNSVAPVKKLAENVDAVAAINGGFFDTGKTRLPVGLVKIKRRIVFEQFLNRAVLGIDEHGQLDFDRFNLHSYVYIPAIDFSQQIHGYNRKRKENELIVFTPEFGKSTRTNEWGVEIVLHRISPERVDKPFILLEPDRYIITGVNHQDTPIPPDGVVLSIHRPALEQLEWLKQVYPGMEMQLKSNVPPGWESYPYLLGGGPLLLKDGKDVLDPKLEKFSNYFSKPNARTAVARTLEGRSYIIVVDRAGGSGGATWEELTAICTDLLDCTDAMGFDGGGSSTMFLGDEIVNAPAGGGVRDVANILAVVPFESFI
ncbi:MAG: phosphodiester glycosidase family protein [bacterium]